MRYAIALTTSIFLLTGCKLAPSDAQPDVQAYTRAELKEAAKELKTYGPNMPIVAGKMIPDYGVMRDQARHK